MKEALLIILGFGVGFWFGLKSTPVVSQQSDKEKGKEQILARHQTNDRITNDDVEKLLGVSDATATRYLDELEKEGKLRQVGKTGKYVYYEKV